MVTIKDVASDANVSVGTVSKVLNNLYVKPENRERVEASIKKLGYQVNTYARGLKAQQTYTIAMILPDLVNPFFALLVNYAEQVLASFGYKLLVCNSHHNEGRELFYINMTKQNKVDGIIALTYSNTEEFCNADIPIVSIDRHFNSRICCVSSDNEMGGFLAARKFVQTGCKNVVYLRNGSCLEEGETLKRGKGFLDYCHSQGVQAVQIQLGDQTTLSQEDITHIHQFLEECNQPDGFLYDGIFTSSDVHAMLVQKKLLQMGIAVPDQVQIIGYDGLRVLNVGDPVVSSIEQPVKEMALACVESLLRLINHQPVEPEMVLPVNFIEGGTTKTN